MKAIILAAGRGSRLGHLTDSAPKCLLKIDGVTLLDRQLRIFGELGIENIAIVTGYKREHFDCYKLKEFYNENWQNTNMVYSLEQADEWLTMDDCIVSYSDIFYDASAIELLIDCKNDIAITYDKNWLQLWSNRFENPLEDAESFALDKDCNLADIGKRSDRTDSIQGQYMGLLKFTPKGWNIFKEHISELEFNMKSKISMTEALSLIVTSKIIPVRAIEYDGVWGEIDTINDFSLFQDDSKKS